MNRILLIATLSLVAACGRDTGSEPASAADRFPRLSHAQWERTVQDLFRLPAEAGLSASFTPDPQLGRFDNNVARLGLTGGLWQDYQRAAEAIAERVVNDPMLLAAVVPDPAAAEPTLVVASFGLRAFRRPLLDVELARYVALFESAGPVFPQHDAFTAGVRLTIQGMLQSPFFLYRTELSDAVAEGAMPLNGYEVAARLSYLFWNSMPDDALFAAAKAGELDDADGVRLHASRMFDDPRTRAQFRRFHYQAFSVAEYADIDKSTTVFPGWRREIGPMMQEEVLRFLDSVIISDGGVADVLTSTKAFVNADLAKIYGVPGSFGADYREVELDPTTRAGLLTRAGFLARNATLDEPDPIHRGVFINLNVLCRPIAAPPNIPPELERTGDTNREKVDSITGQGTCGEGCHHTMINPIGFAFEGYDAVGAQRTTDRGFPINTAATYSFADGRAISYGNAVDLSQQLASSPEVHGCYTSHLLEFMLGRDLLPTDRTVRNRLTDQSLVDRLPIKELVLSVVSSNTFRVRSSNVRSQP
ncbi:MAG: DUF1592 domain-containing protein [Deltaproteobacteria bacterium]|nr:DUF1592 domain-containing protein [Deltaproteobacteria bacterium]